jgi:putative drug exporter of the RND superfamily
MSTVLGKRQSTAPATGTLAGIARLLVDRRRIVLLFAAIAVTGAALAGLSVSKHLSSGGFTPASAESARADQILTQRFGAGAPNVVLVVRGDPTAFPRGGLGGQGGWGAGAPHAGGLSPRASTAAADPGAPAARAGLVLTRRIAAAPGVVYSRSYWTTATGRWSPATAGPR